MTTDVGATRLADLVGEAVPGGLPGDAKGHSDPASVPPASTGRGDPLGD
jgi:hypothetical protein